MTAARITAGALVAALCFLPACLFDSVPDSSSYEINLYSGIRGLANVGDTWTQIKRVCKYSTGKLPLPSGSDRDQIQFNNAYSIPAIGVRLYLREGRVALVEIQEPFEGVIQGKNFKLFKFSPPPGKSWEDILILQFGPPVARASGGRLGSEALFYPWGDVSYNRMGANELAIYHDPDISRFRQLHFGRDLGSFFPQ